MRRLALIAVLGCSCIAIAAKRLPGDRLDTVLELSFSAHGDLQACAKLSPSYARDADALEAKVLQLLRSQSHIDVERSHETFLKKADFVRRLTPEPKSQHCEEVVRPMADRTIRDVDALLRKAYAGKVPATPDCPLPAKSYQDRFKQTGDWGALTCFQKAGLRELEDAQRQ